MGPLADFEQKINDFIKSNPTFQKVCKEAFTKHDVTKDGKISVNEAAMAMEYIISECEQPLSQWGVSLDKSIPIDTYIQKYDVNGDGTLNQKEFEDFYKKVLVVSAVRSATAVVKKYGIAMAVGWGCFGGIKTIIKSNASEEIKSKLWMYPSWLLGPLLGAITWYGLEQTELVDTCKQYLKENNLLTASDDPAAPTSSLQAAPTPTTATTTSPAAPPTTSATTTKPAT